MENIISISTDSENFCNQNEKKKNLLSTSSLHIYKLFTWLFFFKFLFSKRLHQSIDSIEKKLSGAGGTLTIRCKDFSVIQMDIPSAEACINIASSVELLSNIGKYLRVILFLLLYCHTFLSNHNTMPNCYQDYNPF